MSTIIIKLKRPDRCHDCMAEIPGGAWSAYMDGDPVCLDCFGSIKEADFIERRPTHEKQKQ